MKKLLLILFFVMGAITAGAQETLKWHTDMIEAMKVSEKTKKPMFLFFTGSDWCGWCKRLQKEVFTTPEFAAWAKANVVLVELDFPRSVAQTPEIKQQNAELQQVFRVNGYPTVWITTANKDKEGKVNFTPVGSIGYLAGGHPAWLEAANKILANKPPARK
ncbi:thioredoxin family protein [Flavobacterium cyanobacteriorum]|uniref:Thioredoxin family protein n=1 Tax=Flavobacterium cyanobacteriorum TaxID=2022802 RepID=A0A255Z141_9FLAO|nr:thioredoxin family protein [Flavobacterium cyanobacteriorum]OYQ34380.1 thioredoxin family protein [Flavobacterium cyanobacteriorum]